VFVVRARCVLGRRREVAFTASSNARKSRTLTMCKDTG
jgi:hypothetical protein